MSTLLTLFFVMAAGNDMVLPPCPSSPNCVSSQAAGRHFIEPFPLTGDAAQALDRLREILVRRSDTTVVAADESSIRVEFRTALGFVDDALFVLDAANRVIQIRSAARAGYWDFGKNRRRMEEIRNTYARRAGDSEQEGGDGAPRTGLLRDDA